MKRKMLLLLILVALLLSACRKKPQEETLPPQTMPETTAPVETGPELEYMTAQINGIPAVLETFSRGDTLNVVQAFDERHYVVKLETGYGLVEQNLVRLEEEGTYEAWTGYATHKAELYDNYRLAGDPVKQLASNTKVQVLDDLGWCVLVEHEGSTGYMKQELLTRSTHNGSGAGKTPAGSEAPSGAGQDGGEISLHQSPRLTLLATVAPQKGNPRGRATVLADGTDVVLGYFDRGDRIPVLKDTVDADRLTVYLDGLHAAVSGEYLCTQARQTYQIWEGRSKHGAQIYEDFWMLGSPVDRLNADVEITVLQELENCYLVEAGEVTGYLAKDMVTPVKAEPEPAVPSPTKPSQSGNASPAPAAPTVPSTPAEAPDSGNSDDADRKPEAGTTPPPATAPTEGNAGGNAGGNTAPEWTPPML